MRIILSIYRAIFGNRPAERTGKAFIEYFSSEKCPPEVRENIYLKKIYWRAWFESSEAGHEPLGEFLDHFGFYLDAGLREAEAEEKEKK